MSRQASVVAEFLAGSLDYAGLFPPASLPFDAVVRNYARYRCGPFAWLLGRLIVPAARLPELADLLHADPRAADGAPWAISALAGSDLAADLNHVLTCNARPDVRARVDVLELRLQDVRQVADLQRAAPVSVRAVFEIPWNAVEAWLTAVAAAGATAKFRTGGTDATSFPAIETVASAFRAAAALRVPLKLTAGLHHAVRGTYPLLYTPASPVATMHGFMNVFVAAALALRDGGADADTSGAAMETIASALSEQDASQFAAEAGALRWRRERLDRDLLLRTRKELLLSFGSCSFEEPANELTAVGLV